MGNVILAGAVAAGQSRGGSLYLPLVILVLFGFFYFVMIRPQRNRQRAIMQTQRELTPGMRVRTTAGMYATITAIDDHDVTLEVAPGVEVRFLRRAVMEVISDDGEPGFAPPPAETASPDGVAASDGFAGGTQPTEAGTAGDPPETESAKDERSAP